jgi:hypothetical protein
VIVSLLFWSGARRELALPSGDCKKYLDGVFVFSKDANYYVIRTDTAIIEMINEQPKPYMVKYKVRWSANGCDHDLIFDRTTPRGLETSHKKGDFVHIQVKDYNDKQVSYTMTYKNKPPLEMVMYRVE